MALRYSPVGYWEWSVTGWCVAGSRPGTGIDRAARLVLNQSGPSPVTPVVTVGGEPEPSTDYHHGEDRRCFGQKSTKVTDPVVA